ncbi:GDNF family receptor alpha-4 [Collichthys lucidus]|uniref:GDNF family receptor alpha-4 n=1 Tax=Collichthys lucidus TaxID=240159 RepID=A0A4U5UC94_COLLU|nr:GDNF family receptor alpha-4 [Collichthys lucidus]
MIAQRTGTPPSEIRVVMTVRGQSCSPVRSLICLFVKKERNVLSEPLEPTSVFVYMVLDSSLSAFVCQIKEKDNWRADNNSQFILTSKFQLIGRCPPAPQTGCLQTAGQSRPDGGVLPASASIFPFPPPPTDCVEAHRVCSTDLRCEALYRGLELCAADAAVSPLGEQAAAECLERQDALLAKHPSLLSCKCQRGFRKEEQCLRIYWRVRLLPGEDELEISPYDDTIMDTRMASLVAASSYMQLDGENQCLKAAQDCGLYEKCGSLRSEYVLACTKRVTGTNRCNQHKCHRALRRFLERVPEEYSLGVLFCPCTNTLCGERRRKTIVPSCSYQEMEGLQPNCLHQQSFCRRDDLCRSRLADFLNNCQPSPLTATGCMKDSAGLCLRAYAGLIGTIMTPNYISNSSADVSLWCNCEGSGNQWQECLRLQRMFTHNTCLHPIMKVHYSENGVQTDDFRSTFKISALVMSSVRLNVACVSV